MAQEESESLKLRSNEKAIRWVLDRWDISSGNKTKDALGLFQNPAIYYSGSGIRRGEKLATRYRNEKMVASYKDFTAQAWLKYLMEKYDFTPPKWLTMELMGSTKLGGAIIYFGRHETVGDAALQRFSFCQ